MTKKDDRTGVRAAPFRNASREIVEVRACITQLEEEYRAQTWALYNRQSDQSHYVVNGAVFWCLSLGILTAGLTHFRNTFTRPAFLILLALVGLYTIAGIKSIYLGYGIDKATHALRYRLSRICASESAQLTSALISMLVFMVLGAVSHSLGIMILTSILPVIQTILAVNFDRWRLALKDLRALDDVERKHEQIHRLRARLRELEEGAPPYQEADEETPRLMRTKKGG